MTATQLVPPGGGDPPTSVCIGDGADFDLKPLAQEICRRYRLEYPNEQGRYGDAGNAWCVHDNQYLLHWGAESVDGFVDLKQEVAWLARVLEARHFPLTRLARDLDLASDVAGEQVDGVPGERLAAQLEGAAVFVRSRTTFLD